MKHSFLTINNILYFLVLIVIVLFICLKSINMHKKMVEKFDNHDFLEEVNSIGQELEDVTNNNGEGSEGDENDVDNMTHQERLDLQKKCASLGDGNYGSIISKYSGKIINVESLGTVQGETKYLIKWQPLGGKPGGCLTCNADGTYSTPICNNTVNNQQWHIIKIKNAAQWKREIAENRQGMGRDLESSEYPFLYSKV